MAIFGSSWLDEPVDDDRPIFGRNLLDETHYEYYMNESDEMVRITTKRELSDAIDKDNVYAFDGREYSKKQR